MNILWLFKLENFIAPMGIVQLAAMARMEGHKNFLCELNTCDPLEMVKRHKIDVVAVSTMTGEAKHYEKVVMAIKKQFPGIQAIAGGIHPTVYPEIIYDGIYDAICIGEGEYPFINWLAAPDIPHPNILYKCLPGMSKEELYEKSNIQPLMQDIDDLPFSDWGLVYNNTRLGRVPLKAIMTSRGCPYACSYCFNRNLKEIYHNKGGYLRRHSVEYVIAELKHIRRRWPLSCIKFYDDMLIWKADEWAQEFAEQYRRHIDLPFFAFTRADMASEEVIRLLAYAGCRTLSMSIEAGNNEVRENLLFRKMTNEQIIDAHLLANKYGIKTFTNVILGIPDTEIKHDLESVKLAQQSKVFWIEYLIFEPYPGTWLGDYSIERGYYKPAYKAMHSGYHYKSPLSCFDERDKRIQLNLTTIGVVATLYPKLSKLILKYLIYWKPNKLFLLWYFLVKMPRVRQLYPTETTLWQSMRIYWRSFKQELVKHTQEKEKE